MVGNPEQLYQDYKIYLRNYVTEQPHARAFSDI